MADERDARGNEEQPTFIGRLTLLAGPIPIPIRLRRDTLSDDD